MGITRDISLGIGLVIGVLAGAARVDAATCSWTGAGADNKWSTPANWTGCAASGPVNGDVLYFLNGAAQPANQNDKVGLSVAAIQITGVGANGRHWDISGNALTLAAATSFLTAASPIDVSGASPTFTAPITLGSDIYIANTDSGSGTTAQLRLGNINLGGKTLTFRPDFPIAVNGILTGNGTVIKSDVSSVSLVNNTYTGPTQVNNGTLVLLGDSALGASGAGNETTVAAGAEVVIAADVTVAETLIIEGPGQADAGAIAVQDGLNVTLTGLITVPPTTSHFPSIGVGAGGTCTVTGRIDLTAGGQIGAGGAAFVKEGAGALIVVNPANAWRYVSIDAGTVRMAAAGTVPARSQVLVWLGGTFDLNNFDATLSQLTGGTTTVNGGVVRLGSGTLTLDGGAFFGTITGGGRLVKTASDADLALGGSTANDFSGTTTVNGGTVYLQKSATAIPGPLVVQDGTVEVDTDSQLGQFQPVTANAPGQLRIGAPTSTQAIHQTIGSLTGNAPVVLHLATLTLGGDGRSTIFSGAIDGTGDPATGVCLVKFGPGTQRLDGISPYACTTQINAGTLSVNGTMSASPVQIAGGILGGTGTLDHITVSSGKISPGMSPGVLHAEALSMSGGTFSVELNGPAPGTGYDQIDLAHGNLALSGTAALQVTRGFGPPAGTHFTIVNVGAGTVTGTFQGLPEGASLAVNDQQFGITYHGGDGNDVVLTALEDPPTLSINDVTVTEGDVPAIPPVAVTTASAADTTETVARFTVSLSRPTTQPFSVDFTTVNGTATSPQDFLATSGRFTIQAGTTSFDIAVPINGDRNREPDETFFVQLSNPQGAVSIGRAQGTGTILDDDLTRTYYLSEGATGGFFDEDILIANPNDTTAPVTLTFSKETGEQVVATRSLPPRSHLTVHVDQIPGLEATAASAQVTSDTGVPLAVERSMFWDASYYAGHTGSAVDQPAADWFFAEGSQGFFQTFVLVINPNPTPTDVTFTFLRENDTPVVKTVTVGATTRLTLDAGTVPEIVNRSFGINVHATQPIMAERSMYFGTTPTRLWSGGTESAGVTALSTHWFLAEGATGGFFDTFVLLSNPQSTEAHVTLQYLLDSGEAITVSKTIGARSRLTTNIATENDVRLHNAAVSTVVTSDVPIIAERSMYWPGAAVPWGEGHNSFGVVDAGTNWSLAEGRIGGPLNFHTYILLANPQTTAANVTVTYLRESGAPVVKTCTVPATSRFTLDTGTVPELQNESFGTVIAVTNGVNIIVERSMYWDSNGFFFSGGTNATGIRLQ